MIAILGGSGYICQAFVAELRRRRHKFVSVSRRDVDYTRLTPLLNWLQEYRPHFLINAAGYTGKPNVDACEEAKADTLAGNLLLPLTVSHACSVAGIPWAHVSSGCIYSGAKVRTADGVRVERDMSKPELRALAETAPDRVRGFTESDEPNFSLRHPPCSFYSATKALAEEALGDAERCYVWRPRIPFDEFDNPRNYLSKLQRYAKVYDNVNSISHRGDFAWACIELLVKGAPYGTYNVTNPGYVTARQVVEMISSILRPDRPFQFWSNDDEFYSTAARTPRSNCVLDGTKLLNAGVRLRPVREAIEESLRTWHPELPTPNS